MQFFFSDDILQAPMIGVNLTLLLHKHNASIFSRRRSQWLTPDHAWGSLTHVVLAVEMHRLLLSLSASTHILVHA